MTVSPTDAIEVRSTRDRILLEAAVMFAERGFAAVSVRDIAERAKIKPASIYNHFESKDALFDAIIDTIKDVYLEFYDRMDERIAQATNFTEVLDCFFSELIDVYDIFIYYGYSLIVTEQFRSEKARSVYVDVMAGKGVSYSEAKFSECIAKGWVKPFDAKALSLAFHYSVVMSTLERTHEHMQHVTPYPVTQTFIELRQFILDMVEIAE